MSVQVNTSGYEAISWTPVQVVVWIAQRLPAAIDWIGDQPDELLWLRLGLSEHLAMSPTDAEHALKRAILDGSIVAWGLSKGEIARRAIPAENFIWLNIDHGKLAALDPKTSERWGHVTFRRDDVVRIWPPQKADILAAPAVTTELAIAPAAPGKPILSRPKAGREEELAAWVLSNGWSDESLPGRDDLQEKGKKAFANFTQEDAKWLRQQFASEKSKNGGAGRYRDIKASNMVDQPG